MRFHRVQEMQVEDREVPSYVPPLYRPPSEARSLIFQVTYGCSSDTCTFCKVYRTKRFRVRDPNETLAEFESAAAIYPETRRIFLADGDALALDSGVMGRYLEKLYALFPSLERVTAYATPQNLLRKRPEELRAIRDAGLTMVYVGLESGSPEVLRRVRKGVKPESVVAALAKASAAGFTTSVTVILGLGGPRLSEEHAVETGKVLTACNPDFIGALTLLIGEHNVDFHECMDEDWRLLSIPETLREVRLMLEHIECDACEFRANHASNWLPLKGRLQRDKPALLSFIDDVLADPHSPRLRPHFLRGL